MSSLALSNVINISVATSGQGLGLYNTSNLALFTPATPAGTFGSAGYKIYLDTAAIGVDFGTSSDTYLMALQVFSQQPNILANGGYLVIIPLVGGTELLDVAITRTMGLVQYFGIMSAQIETSAHMLAAAAIAQANNKMCFFASKTAADADPGGILDLLRSNSYTQSRGLLYVGTGVTLDALKFMAAYAGRGLSVNFQGSNTTQTMHLKDLVGVVADAGIDQTLLGKCQTAGVDVYVSIQGVAKTFCSGSNSFFDDVYNLQWFIGDMKVQGFNALAQASTKLPQTENGVLVLKNAYRVTCEQAVANQFLAPGAWNSPTTFGNQDDLYKNIAQRGYYIYSAPVSQQSAAVRATRAAPLIQIAAKFAGALHSSSVIVNINA